MKRILGILVSLSLVLQMTACQKKQPKEETADNEQNTPTASVKEVLTPQIDKSFSGKDADASYEVTNSVFVNFSEEGVVSDGEGVLCEKTTVRILSAGTYILTGNCSNGKIVVETEKTDKVKLVLNNLDLTCKDGAPLVVIEADEFDRSFHHLSPYMAVITSTDADHLDIYGTHEAYLESFAHFTSLIVDGGVLFVKKGIQLEPQVSDKVTIYSYSGTEKADFYADNIRLGGGRLVFDFVTPEERVNDVELGVPVMINVENAVAAMAVAYLNGVTPDELRASMASFAGIRRRDCRWCQIIVCIS